MDIGMGMGDGNKMNMYILIFVPISNLKNSDITHT